MPAVAPARHLKSANLGGSGDDTPFEIAFANLANVYIKDKAPGLMQYCVGFQTLERSDDGDRAAGVMAFKAGPRWFIVPVVYDAGDLKGHELLFAKDLNKFVPLKESWVNYMLSKRPMDLGKPVNRDSRQLGVYYPDLTRSTQAPYKYGEATYYSKTAYRVWPNASWPAWANECVPLMAKKIASLLDEPPAPLLLPQLIRQGGLKVAAAVDHILELYPTLRRPFDEVYPAPAMAGALAEAIERAIPRAKTATTTIPAAPALRFVALEDAWGPAGLLLGDSERQQLLQHELLVYDKRADDQVDQLHDIDVPVTFKKTFTNPTQIGVFRVLMKDGDLKKCLVIPGPLGPDGPVTGVATVIPVDGDPKSWINADLKQIWIATNEADDHETREEWYDWLGKQTDVADAGSLGEDSYHVVIGTSGGTTPFRIKDDAGSHALGGHSYCVNFSDHCSHNGGPIFITGAAGAHTYDRYRDGERIHLGIRTGTKFRAGLGDLYVPAGYRIWTLKADEADKDDDMSLCCGPMGNSTPPPPVLGNMLDVQLAIATQTKPLQVLKSAGVYEVNGRRVGQKVATLQYLIRDCRLREADALAVVFAADSLALHHRPARFAVKQAAGDPFLTDGGPNAPIIDDQQLGDTLYGSTGGVPSYNPLEREYRIPDMATDGNYKDPNRFVYPDQEAVQQMGQAAESGQRDVFDASMVSAVSSILKNTSDDRLIDSHIKALSDTLDRIGRILLGMIWHKEQLADRYGEANMPEMLDQARTTFDNLGDFVLGLKTRSVEASPDEAGQLLQMGEEEPTN